MRGQVGDRIGQAIHLARGSRSLGVAGLLVLFLTSLESALPPRLVPLLSGLALASLTLGLATLSREGAAAQANLPAVLERTGVARVQVRLLVLPILLLALLLPRLFLGAYGIPHMTPLTGLVLPAMQRQVGLIFLAIILMLPILALRQARHLFDAPATVRPRDLAPTDPIHHRRDLLLACTVLLAVAWLLLMRSFWQPFSLLSWPPSLISLSSVRGVTALAFTLVPPVVLFMLLALQAELCKLVLRERDLQRRRKLLALSVGHLLILALCVALHAYDLLWIAKYQAGSSS